MSFEIPPPPKLDALTADAINAISDDDLEYALSTFVYDRIAADEDPSGSIERLPPQLLSWYVAFMIDAEVLNGGFNQLFFNPSGELAGLAPAAFAEMGIPEAGELVERALALLEQHGPALEAAAEAGTIEAFMATYLDQPFSELDTSYAANEERWRAARVRFVRDRASTLGFL